LFIFLQDPIEGQPEVGEFLLSALQLLSSLTGIVEALSDIQNDPTHLWTAIQVTDLAGTVSMLYGMLLHQVTFSFGFPNLHFIAISFQCANTIRGKVDMSQYKDIFINLINPRNFGNQ
jgi:hypothetical protein